MPRFPRACIRLARLGWAIARARLEARPGMTAVEKATWQQRQARRMLAALEIEVSVTGAVPREGLMVCNHLGYLDVLVIAAQGPMVFVAKSEVRSWPFVGVLLGAGGAILAERGRTTSAGKTVEEIREALRQGLPVMLFPEGTSSDGSSVLPFKPALLQAAIEIGSTISPAAISYHATGGCAATDVCYWGDHQFASHLVRLASVAHVRALLSFGAAMSVSEGRKVMGKKLHSEISGMLFPGDPRSAEDVSRLERV